MVDQTGEGQDLTIMIATLDDMRKAYDFIGVASWEPYRRAGILSITQDNLKPPSYAVNLHSVPI